MLNGKIKSAALALPLLIFAVFTSHAASPLVSVTLAWSPTADPSVVGYRVYDGIASQVYTNVIDVGSATTATVSNLVPGVTYYFAVTAYTASGLESPFSGEISYTPALPTQARLGLAINVAGLAILTGTAPPGYKYDVLASQDLRNWTAIANITSDATGTLLYTDVSTPTSKRFYLLRQTSP